VVWGALSAGGLLTINEEYNKERKRTYAKTGSVTAKVKTKKRLCMHR